jgi:hypothetical protein
LTCLLTDSQISYSQKPSRAETSEHDLQQTPEFHRLPISEFRRFMIPDFLGFVTSGLHRFKIPDLYKFVTWRLHRFKIPDLHKFVTSRLRRFKIPDLHEFATSRLRRFKIPDLHKFATSRLRGSKIPDPDRFNVPENLFHEFRQTRRSEGDRFFLNSPTTAPRGKRVDSDDLIPRKTLKFSENVTLGTSEWTCVVWKSHNGRIESSSWNCPLAPINRELSL